MKWNLSSQRLFSLVNGSLFLQHHEITISSWHIHCKRHFWVLSESCLFYKTSKNSSSSNNTITHYIQWPNIYRLLFFLCYLGSFSASSPSSSLGCYNSLTAPVSQVKFLSWIFSWVLAWEDEDVSTIKQFFIPSILRIFHIYCEKRFIPHSPEQLILNFVSPSSSLLTYISTAWQQTNKGTICDSEGGEVESSACR